MKNENNVKKDAAVKLLVDEKYDLMKEKEIIMIKLKQIDNKIGRLEKGNGTHTKDLEFKSFSL